MITIRVEWSLWGALVGFLRYFYKSTKNSWHGSDPPPFWQCQDFESSYTDNPSLMMSECKFIMKFFEGHCNCWSAGIALSRKLLLELPPVAKLARICKYYRAFAGPARIIIAQPLRAPNSHESHAQTCKFLIYSGKQQVECTTKKKLPIHCLSSNTGVQFLQPFCCQTSRKSCNAAALLRAEQGPCEPSGDFISKFGEK